jgi:hypothetical protein
MNPRRTIYRQICENCYTDRLLEDREFSHQMASAAQDDAMSRFHPKVIASKHLEIYQEVLSIN